jgi:hypothetical protein
MLKNKRIILTAALLLGSLLLPDLASATQLTQSSVSLGRLGISDSVRNTLLVTFKLNTTPTSVSKIKVTFPTGFTITGGSPTVGSTFPLTPASITAPPGLPATATATSAGGSAGGSVLVSGLTSASLTSSTLYGFTIPTGTITNPATSGQYNVTVESDNSTGTAIDTTTTPVFIYGSSTDQDQVVVSAQVAPNFSFSLSSNTDTVPKLDPSARQTSTGVTMTVGTNSPLGYTAYVASHNDALVSPSTSTPINTGTFGGGPDSVTPGTNMYGFVPSTGAACTTCIGTITYDTEYNVTDATHAGSFAGTDTFASFVSRNGYTNADQILLQERAAVSNTVAYANNYADTLTIVAAGNF